MFVMNMWLRCTDCPVILFSLSWQNSREGLQVLLSPCLILIKLWSLFMPEAVQFCKLFSLPFQEVGYKTARLCSSFSLTNMLRKLIGTWLHTQLHNLSEENLEISHCKLNIIVLQCWCDSLLRSNSVIGIPVKLFYQFVRDSFNALLIPVHTGPDKKIVWNFASAWHFFCIG